MSAQFDRLDEIALNVAKADESGYGVLSTGEKLYVALAANRHDLLADEKYTLVEAIDRLGVEWTAALLKRWRYAGNPRLQE